MTIPPRPIPIRMALALSSMMLTGCNVGSAPAPTPWQQSAAGAEGYYQAQLDCVGAPQAGQFHDCQVSFSNRQNQAVAVQTVRLEGAMPAHGHGLPTAPVLTSQDELGHYRIDGLQYNMPGRWLLGFAVEGALGDDRIIFDFSI